MPPIRVLILGHSFIRRVHDFLCRNFNAHIAKNLSLDGDLLVRWHGIGDRTVSKTREYDLGVVEEFAPNVVIMQLGTNDLTTISAGRWNWLGNWRSVSFTLWVIESGIDLRQNASSFNKQADLLTKYLKVVLEPIPYVF